MCFKILFTLDYEIHGNGDGCPNELLIKPTNQILKLFNKYRAKLTILADACEILKFKEYKDTTGIDRFYYDEIVKQLQLVVKQGHDVQLHIHSSYFKSSYSSGKWQQDWENYNLAELPYSRIFEIVKTCKELLESIIRQVKPDYECNVFRSANWSMMPTKNIAKALINNGIEIDTSVYKYGKSYGRVTYDYSSAYSNIIPWFVSLYDICKIDHNGQLLEIPIYCENRYFWHFITYIRLFRMIRSRFHKHKKTDTIKIIDEYSESRKSKREKVLNPLIKRNPWKLDFNQATGKQLIKAVKRIEKKYNNSDIEIPIVLIGHSKSFIKYNEVTLNPFLNYILKQKDKFCFSKFSELDIESYRKI
jgi:hypothetical protein